MGRRYNFSYTRLANATRLKDAYYQLLNSPLGPKPEKGTGASASTARHILSAILNFADFDRLDEAFCPLEYLMDFTGMSKATTYNNLSWLMKEGWLTKIEGHACHYELKVPETTFEREDARHIPKELFAPLFPDGCCPIVRQDRLIIGQQSTPQEVQLLDSNVQLLDNPVQLLDQEVQLLDQTLNPTFNPTLKETITPPNPPQQNVPSEAQTQACAHGGDGEEKISSILVKDQEDPLAEDEKILTVEFGKPAPKAAYRSTEVEPAQKRREGRAAFSWVEPGSASSRQEIDTIEDPAEHIAALMAWYDLKVDVRQIEAGLVPVLKKFSAHQVLLQVEELITTGMAKARTNPTGYVRTLVTNPENYKPCYLPPGQDRADAELLKGGDIRAFTALKSKCLNRLYSDGASDAEIATLAQKVKTHGDWFELHERMQDASWSIRKEVCHEIS